MILKVKLIKTRLRTTVNEGMLESLLMLSVEKNVQIDYEEIINRFCPLRYYKGHFYLFNLTLYFS